MSGVIQWCLAKELPLTPTTMEALDLGYCEQQLKPTVFQLFLYNTYLLRYLSTRINVFDWS